MTTEEKLERVLTLLAIKKKRAGLENDELTKLVLEVRADVRTLKNSESVLQDVVLDRMPNAVHFFRLGSHGSATPNSSHPIYFSRMNMRTERGVANKVGEMLRRAEAAQRKLAERKGPSSDDLIADLKVPDVVEGCIVEFRSTPAADWFDRYKQKQKRAAAEREKERRMAKRQQSTIEFDVDAKLVIVNGGAE